MDEDSAIWDDSYSVGHAGIDYQHQDLVTMTNRLFEACKIGDGIDKAAFFVTLREAATYAKIHFNEEEKLMAKANYPGLPQHKVEHEKFVETVTETLKKFEAGAAEPIDTARFLKHWLLNHIAKSDKQYAPYLAKLSE